MARIENIMKQDRAVVLASLVGLTGLAWLYLVIQAQDMGGMPLNDGVMTAMALKPWTALDFVLMFLMWAVMMVGMMVPSAAPMIMLFAGITRQSREQDHPFASVGVFVTGYIVVWTAFSLAATVLQWGLEQVALLSPMIVSASPYFGGGLLATAGVYQMTPLKEICLKHCRHPVVFISSHWRPGTLGALRMGIEHGAFCVGCCWVLMGILFVGGVMNLLWIAVIAIFVLVEKVAPFGSIVGRLGGACMVLAGGIIVING